MIIRLIAFLLISISFVALSSPPCYAVTVKNKVGSDMTIQVNSTQFCDGSKTDHILSTNHRQFHVFAGGKLDIRVDEIGIKGHVHVTKTVTKPRTISCDSYFTPLIFVPDLHCNY